MALEFHPPIGTILICDFAPGFREPEMVKRRPVVLISPHISKRGKLCTVVPLSSTAPNLVMPYHCKIELSPCLPEPWYLNEMWAKGDMIYTVGFHRLDLIREGKDETGKRKYRSFQVSKDQLKQVRKCVMSGLGLINLTQFL